MNEKVKQVSVLKQIQDEFKIIALTALVATAAIWLYLSLNLLWTAAVYFGFLLLIALLYITADYLGPDQAADNNPS